MRIRRIDLTHNAYTYLRIFTAEERPAAPVVLVSPGYGTPAGALDKFALLLRQQGLHVVTFDLRGQGASRPRPNPWRNWGFQRHIQDDFPQIVAEVHELFPEAPVYLLAHSLGGQLASLYASQHPGEIDGLVLLATGVSHWRNHDSALTGGFVSVGVVLMNAVAQLLRVYPGVFGSLDGGYGWQPRGMLWDTGRIILLGRTQPAQIEFDAELALGEIAVPVLAVTLEADPMVPPRVMRDFLRLFTSAEPECAHIATRLGHAGWIARPQSLVDLVAPWVLARAEPGR